MKDPKKVKLRMANWYQENKERINARNRAWYRNNKAKRLAKQKKWYEENRQRNLEIGRKWCASNKAFNAEKSARFRAALSRAIPSWADRKKIKEIYKNRPDGYEVDHIVPLRSNLVCGLHCQDNLQYLTVHENKTKKNVTWPDMPCA